MSLYDIPTKTSRSLLLLLFVLIITACDKDTDQQPSAPPPTKQHVKLNAQNINAYAHEMAQQYQSTLDQLLAGYNEAKKSGNSFDFIHYRNSRWTPAYVALKKQHAQVFADNKAFLQDHQVAPLFTLFEYLIFTGIELKRALLAGDETKQQQVLATAEKERQQVIDIVQQLDNTP